MLFYVHIEPLNIGVDSIGNIVLIINITPFSQQSTKQPRLDKPEKGGHRKDGSNKGSEPL